MIKILIWLIVLIASVKETLIQALLLNLSESIGFSELQGIDLLSDLREKHLLVQLALARELGEGLEEPRVSQIGSAQICPTVKHSQEIGLDCMPGGGCLMLFQAVPLSRD